MAIARKVALSHVVYMGHAFTVEKGWYEGDHRDWINARAEFMDKPLSNK
jgi:hypothetical protein